MSRRPLLPPDKAREIRDRYRLHAENTPRRLASEYGLSVRNVLHYATGGHKSPGFRREDGSV